jgi:hypothetical protein
MATIQSFSEPVKTLDKAKTRGGLAWFWRTNAPLTLTGILMIMVLGGSIIGFLVDTTIITGVNGWIKPAKFGISIAIYSFTLIWLLSFIHGHGPLVKFASYTTAIMFMIEAIIILMQVLRHTTSHFNTATTFDSIAFSIMGMAIVILMCATMLIGVLLFFQKDLPNPAFGWSLRLGLFLVLVGMGLGFLMTSPSEAQLSLMQANGVLTSNGAHSVGVIDGGPGLPLLGWSTVGGDLRIPHFVGLHALQILPLLGWLISHLPLRRSQQVGLVWTVGLGYFGMLMTLTWQAERGQSIIAPDALTLTAFGLVIGVVLVVSLLIIWWQPRSRKLSVA